MTPPYRRVTDDWFDLLRALLDAGARFLVVGAHARRPDTVVLFGLPPNRIYLLTSISGIPDFNSAWATRVEHDVRGRRVPFLGREALLRNKRASARRKDLADVEALGEDPEAPADSG